MPNVRIELVKGVDQKVKAEVARGVVDLLHDKTGLPKDAFQVLFADCDENDWYIGHDSIADLKRKRAKP
jgi:phenylpyruvate tautomerase PptA (4-oxalocrotonate tautomerase family)